MKGYCLRFAAFAFISFFHTSVLSQSYRVFLCRADCKGVISDTIGYELASTKGEVFCIVHSQNTKTVDSTYITDTRHRHFYSFSEDGKIKVIRKTTFSSVTPGFWTDSLFDEKQHLTAISFFSDDQVKDGASRMYLKNSDKKDTLSMSLLQFDTNGNLLSKTTTDSSGNYITEKTVYESQRPIHKEIWILQSGSGIPVLRDSRNIVYDQQGKIIAEVLFENSDEKCSGLILHKSEASE